MKMPVITWKTKKTDTGFDWFVIEVLYGQDNVVLKSGTLKTRAQAKGQAQRWVRFLKHEARAAA